MSKDLRIDNETDLSISHEDVELILEEHSTKNPLILKKHINLINCSIVTLSKRSQKIYNALLYCAAAQMEFNFETGKEDDSTAKTDYFKINTNQLKELMEITKIRKSEIEDALDKLISTKYIAVKIRDDVEEWSGSNLVSEYKYTKNKHTTDLIEVNFKLPDLIRENQVRPERFAQVDLALANKLDGGYAYSLYPFLKANFWDHNFSRIILIDEYRSVIGIADDKFIGRNNNLVSRAVVKPLKEIKEKIPDMADIQYEVVKKGRNIIGIKFFRQPKKKLKIFKSDLKGLNDLIYKFNFDQKVIKDLVKEHGEDRVFSCLQYTYTQYVKRKNTADPIKDLKAYSIKIIVNDYDISPTDFENKDEAEKKISKIQAQQRDDDDILIAALLKEHQLLINEMGNDFLKSLSSDERNLLFKEVNDSHEGLFSFNWNDDIDDLMDSYGKSILFAYVTNNCLDSNDTMFIYYAQNRTGRLVKDLGTGQYAFADDIDDDAVKTTTKNVVFDMPKAKDDAKRTFDLELTRFVKSFKVDSAKFFLASKMGKLLSSQFETQIPNNCQDPDSQLIELVCESEYLDFTVDDILKHNGVKLEDESLIDLNGGGTVASGTAIHAELLSFLPKSYAEIAPLIG